MRLIGQMALAVLVLAAAFLFCILAPAFSFAYLGFLPL